MKTNLFSVVLFLAYLLCGCTSMSAPTPTATPSPTSSQTPKPPTVTATKAPPTATSTITPIPLPTVQERPLDDNSLWAITEDQNWFYVMNADGTGLTRFFEKEAGFNYEIMDISSTGGYIAIREQSADNSDWEENWYNQNLLIIRIKDGKLLHKLPLTNREIEYPNFDRGVGGAPIGKARWSPASPYLAYIGASDGPSADVYLYSVPADEYYQLTNGPTQSDVISWSRDGKYIYNTGTDDFGSGAGAAISGVWVVTTSGESIKLYTPDSYGGEGIYGWISAHTYITNSWYPTCGNINLRSYDIDTGTEFAYWPHCYRSVLAYETTTPSFLLQVDYSEQNANIEPGIYFVSAHKTILLTQETNLDARWMKYGYYILGSPDTGYKAYSSSGEDITSTFETPFPTKIPSDFSLLFDLDSILSDGTWICNDGTLLHTTDSPRQLIPDVIFVAPIPGSDDLLISVMNKASPLLIARAPDYALFQTPVKQFVNGVWFVSP